MANTLLTNVNLIPGLCTLLIATPVAAVFTGSVYMNVSTTSALSLAAAFSLPLCQTCSNRFQTWLMLGGR